MSVIGALGKSASFATTGEKLLSSRDKVAAGDVLIGTSAGGALGALALSNGALTAVDSAGVSMDATSPTGDAFDGGVIN